jgi:beta-fructofuranosidase
MGRIFYKPEGAWAADFIPFYRDGRYHLFYLHDWRDPDQHGEGTPWFQVSTEDFVHFTEHGEMLPRGSEEEQDLYVFTGSVIESEGTYHIFYTGHNPHFPKRGRPAQAVMHAVSQDLLRWEKIPEHTFYAPADQYEPHDWRDPFVFWNPEEGEYWMLLAARLRAGPSRRRGCTAICSSVDLERWRLREPLWAPGLYYTHECPDLFAMGDWWYLVFSEFSERCVTRYRMSRSLRGPWLVPSDDALDGRAFYAAKTASDGVRRFIFGWNSTREHERDYHNWQWGGNLVVHEIAQRPDGTLAVRVPTSVDGAFGHREPVHLLSGPGDCSINSDMVEISAPSSFGCATAEMMPGECKLEATVTFTEGAQACGIMLRVSEDLEEAYYIRLEPHRNRMVFDAWPRKGDVPFMVELERPLRLRPGQPIDLKVLVDGTACEVYAAGELAMSTRVYDLRTGSWGVFVQEGTARFENLGMWVPGQRRRSATWGT